MDTFLVISMAVATVAMILGAIILWFVSFVHYPLQTTLRVSLGVLALLCGSFIVPKYSGVANIHVDLSPLLKIDGDAFSLSSGDPLIDWAIPFATLGALAAICLLRVKAE